MRFTLAAAATVLAALAFASPAARHVLHEKREAESDVWIWQREVPPGHKIPVRVGLTQSNLDNGHDWLMEVSEHTSAKYGQWYTPEQIIDMFAPRQETVDAVSAWLKSHGVEKVSQSVNKQWMQLDINVEQLEAMLKTKYHEYEHGPSGAMNIACDEYYLPDHLQPHIDYITPGTKLMTTRTTPRTEEKRKRAIKAGYGAHHGPAVRTKFPPNSPAVRIAAANPLASCSAVVTPQCVKSLYNISDPTTAFKGNTLGLFADGDWYLQSDMNLYFQSLATNIPRGTTPKCKGIDGAVCDSPTGYARGETNLDLSAAFPLLYPQGISLFQTDDTPVESYYYYNGFFNNFFDAIDGSYCTYTAFGITGNSPIDPQYPDNTTGGYNHPLQCGVYKPTNVISMSYEILEGDPTIPINYLKRQCNEIMKLGLQGVTVVVSSGDSGVGSYRGCFGSYYEPIFAPNWPSACPYTLSVGGSTLIPGVKKEVATTSFASGGGFSNIYSSPSYQNKAVNNFFSKYPPPYAYYETTDNKSVGANYGLYNRIGRGYPDVAALGENYLVWHNGNPEGFGGTSLSSPIFASILTRINEERLISGKTSIGFVHPVLYSHPNVFNDIVTGSNPGCDTDGFSAEPGWDPVTGLGTPKYDKLLNLFMSLP